MPVYRLCHYHGIIDMAGYGVGYWASAMESGKDGCRFTEDETGEDFFVTLESVERAVLELHTKTKLNDYYRTAIAHLVVDGEASDVGSDIADAIVQQACFGEVRYG